MKTRNTSATSNGKFTFLLKITLMVLCFLLSSRVIAYDQLCHRSRPAVAVVLSGGGAKGIAHIGVLQAIEDKGIPIDFIAGTSIGAIVGGLYAAGYSPAEMLEIINSEEFQLASAGKIETHYGIYHMQPRNTPKWIRINLTRDHNFDFNHIILSNIPANLVSPFLMDFLFMEYLGPAAAAANYSFDNLFVPFRCIAANIEDNRGEVMRYGSLADAVRASMTFPFYFKPITIEGKMMMDGGMFNNFPVDVVHTEFQPDIVIGSVVSDNPEKPNPHDIVSQLQNMLMAYTNYDILTPNGILIKPDVPELNLTDFSNNHSIYTLGYDAAIEQIKSRPDLFSYRTNNYDLRKRREKFRSEMPPLVIDRIEVNGVNPNEKRFAETFLNRDQQPVHLDVVKERYLALLAMRRFRHAYPRIIYNPMSGFYDMFIDMEYDSDYFRTIGGNLSTTGINHGFSELQYWWVSQNPVHTSARVYFGNFYTSAALSGRIDLLQRKNMLYLESDVSYSNWRYTNNPIFFFEEEQPSFLRQREISASLLAGLPLGRRWRWETAVLRTQLRSSYYDSDDFTQTSNFKITTISPWTGKMILKHNSLNRLHYATSGSQMEITGSVMMGKERLESDQGSIAEGLSENHAWLELFISAETYPVRSGKWSAGTHGEVFLSGRPLLSNYTSTLAMARQYNPFAFARTRFLPQFRANNYMATGWITNFELSRNSTIRGEAFLFQSFRDIQPVVDNNPKQIPFSYDPRLLLQFSLIRHISPGPVSINVCYIPQQPSPWIFMVNFGNIIFNNQLFL